MTEIRFALHGEESALEALQLRSSLVWEEYRADLERNPDAIALTEGAIAEGRIRVATLDGEPVGFTEWSATSADTWELEGLFVAPGSMRQGIGRRLIDDLSAIARARGVRRITVIANPRALEFYERLGFVRIGEAQTRFGPGIRMELAV